VPTGLVALDNGWIAEHLNRLADPFGVRSSSVLEDSTKASFAGQFESHFGLNSWEDAFGAIRSIYLLAYKDNLRSYAERMGVKWDPAMALIFQDDVSGAVLQGVVQLDGDTAQWEYQVRGGKTCSRDTNYRFFDFLWPNGPDYRPDDCRPNFSEFDCHYLTYAAIQARKALGFQGETQIEFFYSPGTLPIFVQIRELPRVKDVQTQLDMKVPEGGRYPSRAGSAME
jgi:hypothetical protein